MGSLPLGNHHPMASERRHFPQPLHSGVHSGRLCHPRELLCSLDPSGSLFCETFRSYTFLVLRPCASPLVLDACARRSWLGRAVRAATLLPAEETHVCHPWSPHQVRRLPQQPGRLALPWSMATRPGMPSSGLSMQLPPTEALGIWWCPSGLRPHSVFNPSSSSFISK